MRFHALVFITLLLTSSIAFAAEGEAEKEVEAARDAVYTAIAGDGRAGENGVSLISAEMFDVQLMKDVDAALEAMVRLPAKYRDRILSIHFYAPPRSPDAWKSLTQLDTVERVSLTERVKWSREFGESVATMKNLNDLHACAADVDCTGIEQIGRCTKLRFLWLHDNDLSNCDLAPLVNLQELRQLMMCNANVSSAQMKFAEFLPKLGWLAINDNRIDRATIDRLDQIHPKALIVADNQKEE
jgi:hypothetical protein